MERNLSDAQFFHFRFEGQQRLLTETSPVEFFVN